MTPWAFGFEAIYRWYKDRTSSSCGKTGGRAVHCVLYSSIEYVFVKPNQNRVETVKLNDHSQIYRFLTSWVPSLFPIRVPNFHIVYVLKIKNLPMTSNPAHHIQSTLIDVTPIKTFNFIGSTWQCYGTCISGINFLLAVTRHLNTWLRR